MLVPFNYTPYASITQEDIQLTRAEHWHWRLMQVQARDTPREWEQCALSRCTFWNG